MNTSKDIEYIKKIKAYVVVVTVIFLFSAIYGAVITEKSQEGKDMAKDIIENMPKKSTKLGMTIEIFESNIYNSLLAAVFGIGFGIIPIYIAVVNGIAIGSLIQFVEGGHGGFVLFIAMIGLHGILEFPLMFISMGIGLRLGYMMYRFIFKENMGNTSIIIGEIKGGMHFYIKWIIPLILLAAIIEVYITPVIAKELMRLI